MLSLPAANATPGAGAPIAGVTVYAVTNADVAGVPAAPIATATTDANGNFTLSGSFAGTVGLIALNGSSYSATDGASNTGYTLAHANASVGASNVVLYVDKLSGDEQAALATLNADRVAANVSAVSSDTMAQADARLAVAQNIGSATCDNPANLPAFAKYQSFGGVGTSAQSWGDTAGTQWAVVVNYNSPWNQAATFVGLGSVYGATACGNNPGAAFDYYQGLYVQ